MCDLIRSRDYDPAVASRLDPERVGEDAVGFDRLCAAIAAHDTLQGRVCAALAYVPPAMVVYGSRYRRSVASYYFHAAAKVSEQHWRAAATAVAHALAFAGQLHAHTTWNDLEAFRRRIVSDPE